MGDEQEIAERTCRLCKQVDSHEMGCPNIGSGKWDDPGPDFDSSGWHLDEFGSDTRPYRDDVREHLVWLDEIIEQDNGKDH
jgi:hypothetical protein